MIARVKLSDAPTAMGGVREWKIDRDFPSSPLLANLLAFSLGTLSSPSGRIVLRRRRRLALVLSLGLDEPEAVADLTPIDEGTAADRSQACLSLRFEGDAEDYDGAFEVSSPGRSDDGPTIGARLQEVGRLIRDAVNAHVAAFDAQLALWAQRAAGRRGERLMALAEIVSEMGSWQFDVRKGTLAFSLAARRLLELDGSRGWSLQDAAAHLAPEGSADWFVKIRAALETGRGFDIKAEAVTGAGRRIWIHHAVDTIVVDGTVRRLLGVMRDVTRDEAGEQILWRMAHIDALTGVPNRNYWTSRLQEVYARAKGAEACFTILMFDLDGFKEINDTRGHPAGDAVLIEVARRASALTPENGFFSRLGGDEFAILLDGDVPESDLEALVRLISTSIQLPILFEGHRLQISGTFGSALFPLDASNIGDLMQKADIALYQAKRSSRSSFVSFRSEIGDLFSDKRRAIDLVAAAIEQNRLVPFYQAKVDLKTGRFLCFEALCRVEAADGTVMGPGQFQPAFLDEATSAHMGEVMLEAVTADMAAWRSENLVFGRVALNVAAADFARGDFDQRVMRRLETLGLPTTTFEIEVTENTILGREASVVDAALRVLRDAGLTISLDDFGTGYASLTHLRDAPIQYLKLDSSFIGGLGRGPESAIIVRSIVDLGHSLGMRLVAEGVETRGQAEFLRAIGCDEAQGFLYNRPMPRSAARDYLLRQSDVRQEAEMRARKEGRHKIFSGSGRPGA